MFPPVGRGGLGFHILIETLEKSGFRGLYVMEPERSLPGTPAKIAAVTTSDPGSAYRVHTSSLGEPDAAVVDEELRQSLEALEVLLRGQGATAPEEPSREAVAGERGGAPR